MKNTARVRLLAALMALALLLPLMGCGDDTPNASPDTPPSTSTNTPPDTSPDTPPARDTIETVSATIGLMTIEHDKALVVEQFGGSGQYDENLVLSSDGVNAKNNKYVVDITYTGPDRAPLSSDMSSDVLGSVLRDVIEGQLAEPEIEDRTSTENVGGGQALSLAGESQQDRKKMKIVLCFDGEDGMYLVTFITHPSNYDRYLPYFDDVLKSVEFEAPQPPATPPPSTPPSPDDTPDAKNTFTVGGLTAVYGDMFNISQNQDGGSVQLIYDETVLIFQHVVIPGASSLTQQQHATNLKNALRGQFPIDEPTTIIYDDTEESGVMAVVGGIEWAVCAAEFLSGGDYVGLLAYETAVGDDFYVIMVVINGGLSTDGAYLARDVLASVTFE